MTVNMTVTYECQTFYRPDRWTCKWAIHDSFYYLTHLIIW